jgi:hypothetical protein
MRYYVTASRPNGEGMYIAGEVPLDPWMSIEGLPEENNGLLMNMRRLVSDALDDNSNDLYMGSRYLREELLLEPWGAEALAEWESDDDSRHEARMRAEREEYVLDELREMAGSRGPDAKAAELLEPGHTFEERARYAVFYRREDYAT